jgi:hypothetical protein
LLIFFGVVQIVVLVIGKIEAEHEKARERAKLCRMCRVYKGRYFFFNSNVCTLQNIEDEAVQQLAENCPRLHYLCLSGCSHLTDASLIVLAQQCHMLSTIEVAGCSQFTDAGFQALARVSLINLERCINQKKVTDSYIGVIN